MPLFITTHARVSNNSTLYLSEIAPHYIPSNGGFSVTQYTLEGLYKLFQKARCWWTTSNDEYPMIRYTHCKLKLFKSENTDYVFTYHNCYPMESTLQTFQTCQPNILQLNKRHKIMRCKKHNPYKRPYKTLTIHPPATMKNKWFFQKEIAKLPLLMTMCSAMSLDRWYASSTAISTSIGFRGLNFNVFQYHNFTREPTAGYKPNDTYYFYSFQQSKTNPLPNITDIETKNLIFLGKTTTYTVGTSIGDSSTTTPWNQKLTKYASTSDYWGNVFVPAYLTGPLPLLKGKLSIHELSTNSHYNTSESSKLSEEHFSYFQQNTIINYRYNSYNDEGDENSSWVVDITSIQKNWEPPLDPNLQAHNYPFWIQLWGFLDWLRLKYKTLTIDTEKAIVLHSTYIDPKQNPIIPLDEDFLQGRSPFRPKDNITPNDKLNWHPKVAFQMQTINEIAASGPATVKLPPNVSVEAHLQFSFYFKLGGCAPPSKSIEDPNIQPYFPNSNNLIQTPSLQDPSTPIQNFLYNFDWRRDFITKTAEQRIQKYLASEQTFSASTGSNPFIPAPHQEAQTTHEETQEKENQTLQLLINQQQRKQQELRQRILRLILDTNL